MTELDTRDQCLSTIYFYAQKKKRAQKQIADFDEHLFGLVRQAREDGNGWRTIAKNLGVTHQWAQDWYNRRELRIGHG